MTTGASNKKPAIPKRVAYRKLGNKITIVDPESNTMITLNEVGSRVFELVGEPLEAIVESICKEFEVDEARATREVEEFIYLLEKKRLLRTL